MPDFLSNLVDRALGQAPVLERRRRFLFEPPSETGGLNSPIQIPSLQQVEEPVEPAETPAVPQVPSPKQQARPRSRARRQPPVPLASSADITEPRSSEMAEANATQNTTTRRPTLPATPRTEFREERIERDATPVHRVQQHRTRVEGIETIIEREVPVSQTSTRNAPRAESLDRQEPSLQTLSLPAPSVAAPSTKDNRIRELEERLETIRDRKPAAISSKPIEQGLKPARTPPAKRLSPASEPMAPEIRVTIGRLEIRAVAPSPPQTVRAKSAAPRLSLEAYLGS